MSLNKDPRKENFLFNAVGIIAIPQENQIEHSGDAGVDEEKQIPLWQAVVYIAGMVLVLVGLGYAVINYCF